MPMILSNFEVKLISTVANLSKSIVLKSTTYVIRMPLSTRMKSLSFQLSQPIPLDGQFKSLVVCYVAHQSHNIGKRAIGLQTPRYQCQQYIQYTVQTGAFSRLAPRIAIHITRITWLNSGSFMSKTYLNNTKRASQCKWSFFDQYTQQTTNSLTVLPLSSPVVSNGCTSKCLGPYCSNARFLFFDIRALWRSGLSAKVPELVDLVDALVDSFLPQPEKCGTKRVNVC